MTDDHIREAGLSALEIAESWVIDQLEGTRMFGPQMARLAALREILAPGSKPNGEDAQRLHAKHESRISAQKGSA